MTWALCCNCGSIKFGALCPCPECQVSSCGNMKLDILFSDHNLSRRSLEELGAVIAVLRDATDDPELRFAAFLYYVTKNHPQVLHVDLTPAGQKRIEALLSGLDLPSVKIRRAPGFDRPTRSRREGLVPPEPEPPGGDGSGRAV